jgi:hypothetical protein
MSDNKNILLENKGWSEMTTLLDKEMPVENNKRRFILWFILASIMLGAMAFIGINEYRDVQSNSNTISSNEINNANYSPSINNNKSDEKILNSNIDEAKIGDIKQAVDAEKGSISTTQSLSIGSEITKKDVFKKRIKPQVEIDGEISKSSKKSTQIASSTEYVKSTKLSKRENSAQLQDPKNTQNIPIEKTGLINLTKNSVNNIESDLQPEVINSEGLSLDIKLRKGELINETPNKLQEGNTQVEWEERILPKMGILPYDFPYLKTQRLQLENTSIKPIAGIEPKAIISPYIFTAANYQVGLDALGYVFGAGIDMKHNNLGVYLELGYSKTSFGSREIAVDFSPSGKITVVENEVFEDIGGAEASNKFNLVVQNFTKLTSSMKEVKVNLGIRKAIMKKLNINGGISYSRLLTVNNKPLSVDYELQDGFLGISTYNVSSNELEDKGAYAKYDITPHIGLEYNIFRNAYFSANYNYGLKNLIANTELESLNSLSKDESIFRRYLEVKMRYNF